MMGHKITERLDWILRFETQPYRGEQSGRQIWKGNHIVGTHSLKSATYEDHQNNATYTNWMASVCNFSLTWTSEKFTAHLKMI